MNLALKDGRISLTVALGTGKLDTAIDPDNVRFDDNVWHHVLVQRHSSAVSTIFLTEICFTTCFLIIKINTKLKDNVSNTLHHTFKIIKKPQTDKELVYTFEHSPNNNFVKRHKLYDIRLWCL